MLMYALRFLSRSDALCRTQTGSSLQHQGFRGYLKYHKDYFVIQLLSEPDKHVACLFKRQLLLILSRTQN